MLKIECGGVAVQIRVWSTEPFPEGGGIELRDRFGLRMPQSVAGAGAGAAVAIANGLRPNGRTIRGEGEVDAVLSFGTRPGVVAVSHDGSSAFTFRLAFSEAIATGYVTVRDAALLFGVQF